MAGVQIKRPEKNKSTTIVFKKQNLQTRRRETRRRIRSLRLVYRKNREKNPGIRRFARGPENFNLEEPALSEVEGISRGLSPLPPQPDIRSRRDASQAQHDAWDGGGQFKRSRYGSSLR